MLFLSTVTFATVYLDTVDPHRKSLEMSLSYKSDIIRGINASMGSPEKAVSNSTIGVVNMLAATEVSTIISCRLLTGSLVHVINEIES